MKMKKKTQKPTFIFDIETEILPFERPSTATTVFTLEDMKALVKKIERDAKINKLLGEPEPKMIYFGQ